MFAQSRIVATLAILLSLLFLSACGSDIESGSNQLLTCNVPDVPNAGGTACVAPPPIDCPAPLFPNETNDECISGADPSLPDPTVFPDTDQAVLYYNRAAVGATNQPGDSSYEGYRLHTFNGTNNVGVTCQGYSDPDTDWANGRIHDGVDPNYGAYWVLDLVPGYADTQDSCHHFIVHIGTDDAGKDLGGIDAVGPLDQDDPVFARMNFTLTGEPTVFEYPILSLGPKAVEIEGQAAHWLDSNTLLWNIGDTVSSVKLHFSTNADLEVDVDTGLNGTALDLEPVTLTPEQIAIAPHLAGMMAFQGDWTAADAKQVLKGQAVLASYDADGVINGATGIQPAKVIDQLYTLAENDANEAALGPVYHDNGSISAYVWAPTAQSVNLLLFDQNKTLNSTHPMTYDDITGVWTYTGGPELDRVLYRYEVTVYHPKAEGLQVLEVTDPYSVALSTNSRFSRFVNLNDEDTKPDGWDGHAIPTIENWEDAVIYEGHIRDFSARDESISAANRGKYMAFTEEGSAPVEHLRKLAQSGVTHFHVLPANDIATIEEDVAQTVDLNSTFSQLCQLNRNVDICNDASIDGSVTLLDMLNSFDTVSEAGRAQELVDAMRSYDQFNWGYDPFHFNAPEGSYSSDPEGIARIKEMRAMNMALHGVGLRVALDVVYNHTNASALFSKSVLDKVVPMYYHRYEVEDGAIVRETCCDDTEPRNVMMEKLMEDSLVLWATQYKFDAFRFDIMSQASKDTMVRLWDKVRMYDEDNYFYGEGWTRIDRGYEQANQPNMAGTQIGTFNDRIREAVRQGEIFSDESGDAAALAAQDRVKMSLAGTLTDYVLEDANGVASTTSAFGGYALDPADIINYVSKHDNETLWDIFNYNLPSELTLMQRVRAQNVAATLPLMAQGIPFLQMGGDLLRSKSMDRNTFDAGDWFNFVDFTYASNNWNIGLPLAQDNASRWEEIGLFMNSPERAATMSDIEFARDVFDEFLQIRTSTSLFRLNTAQEIIDRVGFHNIGRRQAQGLILMSIDDGVTPDSELLLDDRDPGHDAVVVAVNTGYEEQSITVNTATGFELHPVHAASIDPTVRSASFTEGEEGNGTFTIPALTTAVFVKVQGGAQGYGLSAIATAGAPDVVPYGSTEIFLRGTPFDWGNPATADAQFTYAGDGIYTLDIALEADVTHNFKIAEADWDNRTGTPELGAVSDGDSVTRGEGYIMAASNSANLQFTADVTTTYTFELDASETSAPVLTINYEEPYFNDPIFLRGTMYGWGNPAPDDAQLIYQGAGIYEIAIELPAGEGDSAHNFKIASRDWDVNKTVDLGSGEESPDVTLGVDKLLATNGDNLRLETEETATYIIQLNANNLEEQTINVFDAQIFGATPVYIRGAMNGWADPPPADSQLIFGSDGTYSVTLPLDVGGNNFKVADAAWDAFNIGAVGDEATIQVGQTKLIGQGGGDILMTIDNAADYEFKVKGPLTAPTVTVTEVP